MSQQTSTVLLRGGLNIVSPAVAIPPGQCTAALNYEPEVRGYRRIAGFERYDGRPAPSTGADADTQATLRAAIEAVPGQGPVRGVWVYDGHLYAFRDSEGGEGRMYRDSAAGWVQQTFGSVLDFNTGTAEFVEGEVLTGGTSGATATIERLVLQSGTFSGGDAQGYMVLSNVSGTFQAETVTSPSGSATATAITGVKLSPGGVYEFVNHNFYGATKRKRMYFANGTGSAMEWGGDVLSPIRTGNDEGTLEEVVSILARNDDTILARNDDDIIARGEFDIPSYIAEYRNHLFLAYEAGAIIHSGIGEPLDYRAIAGAGEISFGDAVTGFVSNAASALVVFARNRIEYIAGNDSSDFQMFPISDNAGCYARTSQMSGNDPIYLDDGGIRNLSATASFGDFRMGTMTQLIEPLFKTKRAAGVNPKTAMTVKAKDQYRLFFDDRSGLTVYRGRKSPEVMPFMLPVDVFCACSGELNPQEGERHFIGCEDGFVYELDSGTSFDGEAVQAYIRLAWNTERTPAQKKRFHKATVEVDCEEDIDIGVTFALDFNIPGNPGSASQRDYDVSAGSQSFVPVADYDDIDWTKPVQGLLEAYLDGIGQNMALTIITEHTLEKPHTLSAMTTNFSWRGSVR